MQKLFYLVPIEVMQDLKWIALVNSPYKELNLKVVFEIDFWFYLRKDGSFGGYSNQNSLWSILSDKKLDFENSCQQVNIPFSLIDLDKEYAQYKKDHTLYKPSKQDDIPEENKVSICKETFPSIICGKGTSQIFLEHYVGKKDGIKLYINSNEITGHNIPHCHVKYNHINNYCVLSLVDAKKIAPDGNLKNAVIYKAQNILQKNIQKAREIWNDVSSLMKFEINEHGHYTDKYKKA